MTDILMTRGRPLGNACVQEAELQPQEPLTLPSPAPDSPVEALGWLGDTADEVAEGLRVRGIKGMRAISDDCPLARYLKTWWDSACVWEGVSAWNHDNGHYFYDMETPPACFEFAKKFDAREYPDLLD